MRSLRNTVLGAGLIISQVVACGARPVSTPGSSDSDADPSETGFDGGETSPSDGGGTESTGESEDLGGDGDGEAPCLDTAQFRAVGSNIVDARRTSTGDLVWIENDPPTLHVLTPTTDQGFSIQLPAEPLALSVAPTDDEAVVGHADALSRVSFQDLTVQAWPVAGRAGEVLHRGDGVAYFVDPYIDGLNEPLWVVNLETGEQVPHPYEDIVTWGTLALAPTRGVVYAVQTAVASFLARLPLETAANPSQAKLGDFDVAGLDCWDGLWISLDESILIQECGLVYGLSDAVESDLTYRGTLEGSAQIRAAAVGGSEVAVLQDYGWHGWYDVPDYTNGALSMQRYELEFLTPTGEPERLPRVEVEGECLQTRGHFLFSSASGGGSSWWVVAEIDTESAPEDPNEGPTGSGDFVLYEWQ